jgi:hypothetical protein
MKLEDLDRLFEDTAHRRLRFFYYCKADPRVVAPSRPTWKGFQINFAHPWAFRVLLLYLAVLICPTLLAFVLGPCDPVRRAGLVGFTFAASVTVLVVVSKHLSRQHTE